MSAKDIAKALFVEGVLRDSQLVLGRGIHVKQGTRRCCYADPIGELVEDHGPQDPLVFHFHSKFSQSRFSPGSRNKTANGLAPSLHEKLAQGGTMSVIKTLSREHELFHSLLRRLKQGLTY